MTKIIRLTDPKTGCVRRREDIKADPECSRPFIITDAYVRQTFKANRIEASIKACGRDLDTAKFHEWIQSRHYFGVIDGLIMCLRLAQAGKPFPWEPGYERSIVREFLSAKSDRSKLKTFVNTTLGESWEEDESEKIPGVRLYERREHYQAEVPGDVLVVTAGIDTQDDRFEIQFDGWGVGEERYREIWYSPIETTYLQFHQHLPGRKGNTRQQKKAFKKAEQWYYNVYLKSEVSP